MSRVVHLPHPSVEHIIAFNKENFPGTKAKKQYIDEISRNQGSGTPFPWNRGGHRRKFICNNGNYAKSHEINEDHLVRNVDLYFWGEWEQPSMVTESCPNGAGCPAYIHRPFLGRLNGNVSNMYERYGSENNPGLRYQNTDPYVFGSRFYYSCCRQTNQMKNLGRGDIIIFYGGDSNNGKNVKLDTVFVVGGKCLEYGKNICGIYFDDPHGSRYYNDNAQNEILRYVSEAYRDGVLNAIWYGHSSTDNFHNVLYYGATYDDPVDGMFSYFICKPQNENGEMGFPRVSYRVDNVNNNKFGFSYSLQKQKYAEGGTPILEYTGCNNTYDYWLKLTEDILNQKEQYKLGVYTEEPESFMSAE